jgi:hypothetical protein
MSGGWAVTGQKMWVGAGRSPALIRATTRPLFLPNGLGLDGQGVADPVFQKVTQPQAAPSQKWRMGRSEAQVIRRRRDRLKGQPQECQHSAAAGGTRDRLPPARRSISLAGAGVIRSWPLANLVLGVPRPLVHPNFCLASEWRIAKHRLTPEAVRRPRRTSESRPSSNRWSGRDDLSEKI